MKIAIIIISMLLAGALEALIGIILEKRAFNHGYCENCHEQLELFDYDSIGGRGYVCPRCGHKVWVSYNIVDKDYEGRKKNE